MTEKIKTLRLLRGLEGKVKLYRFCSAPRERQFSLHMKQQEQGKVYTFEELLNTQGYFIYTNVGYSMMPLLRQRRDIIEIRKREGRVKKYEVALYKKQNRYILHRCIAVLPDGKYVFAGDHNIVKEFDVTDDKILGVMTRVIRDKKSIDSSNIYYRLYYHLWVDFFSIRVLILRANNLLTRLKSITFKKVKNYLNWKIVYTIDAFNDYYITGRNLTKTIPSASYVAEKGGTPSQPAKYLILEKVFSHISISSTDSFIDVGCGQGRVLAFLKKKRCPCPIYGVELSKETGKVASEWTKKYKNINVFLRDAFLLDYNEYTVLFLSQPFYPDTFYKFIQLLEHQLKHSITLIYLFDHASGGYLKGRRGWTLKYREEFLKIHGLQVVVDVRRFSIWEYNP